MYRFPAQRDQDGVCEDVGLRKNVCVCVWGGWVYMLINQKSLQITRIILMIPFATKALCVYLHSDEQHLLQSEML